MQKKKQSLKIRLKRLVARIVATKTIRKEVMDESESEVLPSQILYEIRDALYLLKGDVCAAYEQAESELMECEMGEGEI